MKTLSAEEITEMIEAPTDDPLKKWNALQRHLMRDAPIRALIIALQQARSQYAMNTLMDILRKRGAKSAVPVLASYIDDPNPVTRHLAIDAIEGIFVRNHMKRGERQRFGSPILGERIMQRFEKTESLEELRSGLALALGAIRYRPAIPALIEALQSQDSALRSGAAIALGELEAVDAIPALVEARDSESASSVRQRINYVIEELMKMPASSDAETVSEKQDMDRER